MGYIRIWVCRKCKHSNRWNNNHCNECGKQWEGDSKEPARWICTKCNTINLWANNYCDSCGAHYEADDE
jgi:ribosomal protein L40E